MRIRRSVAVAASLLLASTLASCGLLGPDVPSEPPTAEPTASAAALPTDAANNLLLGPWRPAPVNVPDDLRSSIEFVCRNPEDPALMAAIQKVPAAVVDARGGGLASVVFADEHVAFECRVKLELVGAALGATILEPPSRLAPSADPGDGVVVVSDNLVDDDAGSRTVLIGRVGPQAFRVIAGFDDESEVVTSKDNGWYMAWWPGIARPGAVAAVDTRSIAQAGAHNPHDVIEGRVTPATWWLDPAAAAPSPDATTISALILEQACASGHSPEGRVVDPVVFSSERSVLVQVFVRRRPGGQDCQGNQPFPIEIKLPEPLGARSLLDGSTTPPRDASVPPR